VVLPAPAGRPRRERAKVRPVLGNPRHRTYIESSARATRPRARQLAMGKTMTLLTTLLLIAMCATLVVLVVGLVGFFLGGEFNAKYGNKLMRARVALQAVAVLLLLVVLVSAG
jgi:Hypoxia induced protein conserved region